MRYNVLHPLLVAATGFLVWGCGDAPQHPSKAQQTYGASVDATGAIPAPALVAENDQYIGRRVVVDSRIMDRTDNGCALVLETEQAAPLRIEASSSDDGSCAWQVPRGTDGFALAAGTLQTSGDTLSVRTNGVRVTPVQLSESDS